jgi:hypothetical protein
VPSLERVRDDDVAAVGFEVVQQFGLGRLVSARGPAPKKLLAAPDFRLPCVYPSKGKTLLGVYELSDETCKGCLAPPRKDRPREFSAK